MRLLIVIPMLTLSLAGFVVAGFAIGTGKVPTRGRRHDIKSWNPGPLRPVRLVNREQAPGEFRTVLLLGLGMGVFWLVAAVWIWRRPGGMEIIRRQAEAHVGLRRRRVILRRTGRSGDRDSGEQR